MRIRGPDQKYEILEYSDSEFRAPQRDVPGLSKGLIGRLGFAWVTVALFLLFGGETQRKKRRLSARESGLAEGHGFEQAGHP